MLFKQGTVKLHSVMGPASSVAISAYQIKSEPFYWQTVVCLIAIPFLPLHPSLKHFRTCPFPARSSGVPADCSQSPFNSFGTWDLRKSLIYLFHHFRTQKISTILCLNFAYLQTVICSYLLINPFLIPAAPPSFLINLCIALSIH